MSALSRFESFMESLVEGSAKRLFRSPVTPAEITRRLERAMASQQTITVDRIIVPSFYRAFLHPEDFKALEPVQDELEREMANYLAELARERGFTLLQHPVVDVAPDPAVSRRSIQVVAEMTGVHPGNAPAGSEVESTQVIPSRGGAPVHAALPSAELVLRSASGAHAFPLEANLVTLGRGLNNDIVLEDPRISRQHAQIRYRSRRFLISDLGSTNGTYVNGVPVSTEQVLRDGDIVSLGGLELIFHQR
ncbi:FhaA domain-containing protein [Kallotenue papyrolyticum]|uniref:FhaA domain-containing protein n=1 Tax=Kallotenue papyrolyticum TaxID=1325125 RepID=UPI00047864FC|nr:FHA domain-containing protein [Kallotenue papyrolyticum]